MFVHKLISENKQMGIIGEGSYGKVYRPPIPCDTNKKMSKTVGKVFHDNDDYQTELRKMKMVKSLNANSKFTIPMYETCKENLEIIYADGGQDLYQYLEHHKRTEFLSILKCMRYLCDGLKLLVNSKYVHQDIKLENIVYNGDRMYLIDFGLMTKTTQIYKEAKFLEYDYPPFPPEYKHYAFGANFLNNNKFEIPTIIKSYYKDYKADLADLIKHPSYPTDKIDTYSLGIVIAQLYHWSRKKNTDIEELICGMICFNPSKRWDIDRVCLWFTNLL